MILKQNKSTGFWTDVVDDLFQIEFQLQNVHSPDLCEDRGCAIHNHPSDHPLKDAPLNWRVGSGVLERICVHNVGHPDRDASHYLESQRLGYMSVHGCDGCC